MKLYYQFNISPFCHLCLDVMTIDRQYDDRDENGVIRTHAWCVNRDCPQFEKKFLIPPLSTEAEDE